MNQQQMLPPEPQTPQLPEPKPRIKLIWILLAVLALVIITALIIFLNYFKNFLLKPNPPEVPILELSFPVAENNRDLSDANLPEYANNEIIVSFKKSAAQFQINQFLSANNFSVKKQNKETGFYVLTFSQRKDPAQLSDNLKSNPAVDTISPNYYFYPMEIGPYPDDEGYQKGAQWNMEAINMPDIWKNNSSPPKNPITVAVIDSGVAYENYDPDEGFKTIKDKFGFSKKIPADYHNWRIESIVSSKNYFQNIWSLGPKDSYKTSEYTYVKDYFKRKINLAEKDIVLSSDPEIILSYQYISFIEQNKLNVTVEISPDGEKTWKEVKKYDSPSSKNKIYDLENGWNGEYIDLNPFIGEEIVLRFKAESNQNFGVENKRLFFITNILVKAKLDSKDGFAAGTYNTTLIKDDASLADYKGWTRMQYKVPDEMLGVGFIFPDPKDPSDINNFVDNSQHANDDYGHGTHVAGTITQTTNNNFGVAGVAYGSVNILPVKVLDAFGRYGSCDIIADGVNYAVKKGADIINLSLGGKGDCPELKSAVENAQKKAVVVAACGNMKESKCRYPAAYEETISVGAIAPDEQKAWYSNYGDTLDIMAPGGDFPKDSSKPVWYKARIYQQSFLDMPDEIQFVGDIGTSMAAPHVAGVAALLLSQNPELKPEEVKNILECTAKDLGSKGKDNDYGYGLIDAAKVLDYKTVKGCSQKSICLACPSSALIGEQVSFYPFMMPSDDPKISTSDFTCYKLGLNQLNSYKITSKDFDIFWQGQDIQGCVNKDGVCAKSFDAAGTATASLKVSDNDPVKCSATISDWKVDCAVSPASPKIDEKETFTAWIDFGPKIGAGAIDYIKQNNANFPIIKDIHYSWYGMCSGPADKDCVASYSASGIKTVNVKATLNGVTKSGSCQVQVGEKNTGCYPKDTILISSHLPSLNSYDSVSRFCGCNSSSDKFTNYKTYQVRNSGGGIGQIGTISLYFVNYNNTGITSQEELKGKKITDFLGSYSDSSMSGFINNQCLGYQFFGTICDFVFEITCADGKKFNLAKYPQ